MQTKHFAVASTLLQHMIDLSKIFSFRTVSKLEYNSLIKTTFDGKKITITP